MVSLASLSAFSQSAATARQASLRPALVAARDIAERAAPHVGLSVAIQPPAPGRPTPRGSLLNLSV